MGRGGRRGPEANSRTRGSRSDGPFLPASVRSGWILMILLFPSSALCSVLSFRFRAGHAARHGCCRRVLGGEGCAERDTGKKWKWTGEIRQVRTTACTQNGKRNPGQVKIGRNRKKNVNQTQQDGKDQSRARADRKRDRTPHRPYLHKGRQRCPRERGWSSGREQAGLRFSPALEVLRSDRLVVPELNEGGTEQRQEGRPHLACPALAFLFHSVPVRLSACPLLLFPSSCCRYVPTDILHCVQRCRDGHMGYLT